MDCASDSEWVFLFRIFGTMKKEVRVRFAPSPTGGLHLGGVRTLLYNYLFARQHGGSFILRIEDTDQSRFVPGAEEYIFQTLNWCGLEPDESPVHGGNYGPYRQSERKAIYREYAEQLVRADKAYYAFDRPEELESMRNRLRTAERPSPQYDINTRMDMRNSLSLTLEETERLLEDNTPYTIRIRMPENETVHFDDLIRGQVSFNTSNIDDKVLLKADGMPTYHLAVVADDHLMKISHAFRGEEWLSSAPVHILLWRWLFGENNMPRWAHFPLILKPDGNGKLSKRDGDRLGFPVFAMDWKDPKSNELTKGFMETGFLPEAFVNLLALLGWNDGSDQEIFSIDDLIRKFSIDRVHKHGAKFDFEKAKWFNHEWIKRQNISILLPVVHSAFSAAGISIQDEARLKQVIDLIRERCTLIPDFVTEGRLFFVAPEQWDLNAIKPKWSAEKKEFFTVFIERINTLSNWTAVNLESAFKELAEEKKIRPGDLLLPMRIMLVGEKKGPPVFDIAYLLGKEETIARMRRLIGLLSDGR
jgi:glutamyl-tRNA synthetase